jgi:hypothetical protein
MFRFERDYIHCICLKTEDRDTICLFEKEWNDFDHFTPATKMLRTTKRKTQPWKSGLPVDWRPKESSRTFPPLGWFMRARPQLFGEADDTEPRAPRRLRGAGTHPRPAAGPAAPAVCRQAAGSLSYPLPKVTDLFGSPNKSVTFGA